MSSVVLKNSNRILMNSLRATIGTELRITKQYGYTYLPPGGITGLNSTTA